LDSGIRQAKIGEAAATSDVDWRLIDDARRENRAELADAWNSWRSQDIAVGQLQAAVVAAEQAFEGALAQQRAGLRTTTEMLELARDLLQVRTNLNSATTTAYLQQGRILAALGALRQQLLLPDAPTYDPGWHHQRVQNQADVPLLTPAIRALDSLTTRPRADRAVRDPAAPLGSAETDFASGY
jgi:outer membrane protein